MLVYIVGVMAAVAIPAYHDYTVKAKVSAAVISSQPMREALGNYYQSNQKIPESLDVAGIPSQLGDGTGLSLDPKHMVLTVSTKEGEIIFTPKVDDQGRITWSCTNGEGLKSTQLPKSCHE